MNNRITTYLTEVYGEGSANARKLSALVDAFEKKYDTIVDNVLVYEEEIYASDVYGENYDGPRRIYYPALALFCKDYFASVSLQPDVVNMTVIDTYRTSAYFLDNTRKLRIGGFDFPKVLGDPHWAMDVIRMDVIPHIIKH